MTDDHRTETERITAERDALRKTILRVREALARLDHGEGCPVEMHGDCAPDYCYVEGQATPCRRSNEPCACGIGMVEQALSAVPTIDVRDPHAAAITSKHARDARIEGMLEEVTSAAWAHVRHATSTATRAVVAIERLHQIAEGSMEFGDNETLLDAAAVAAVTGIDLLPIASRNDTCRDPVCSVVCASIARVKLRAGEGVTAVELAALSGLSPVRIRALRASGSIKGWPAHRRRSPGRMRCPATAALAWLETREKFRDMKDISRSSV